MAFTESINRFTCDWCGKSGESNYPLLGPLGWFHVMEDYRWAYERPHYARVLEQGFWFCCAKCATSWFIADKLCLKHFELEET